MKLIFARLRNRSEKKPLPRDWTVDWTPRDWADLPTHHPRREDDAL